MPRSRVTEIIDEGIIVFELNEITVAFTITINGIDVSDDKLSLSFSRGNLRRLPHFNLDLNNPLGKYNDIIKPGHEIIISLDYDDGNQVKFRGKIDSAIPGIDSSYFIRTQGRQCPELNDMKYTGSFDNILIIDIIEAIILDINTRTGYTVVTFNSSNFPSSSTRLSIAFDKMEYKNVLAQIAKRAGWKLYLDVDENNSLIGKERGQTVDKSTDVIMPGVNFMYTEGIGDDPSYKKNLITVIGNSEGIPIIWTKKGNLTPWIKEEIIHDFSVATRTQAVDRAELEFNEFGVERKQGLIKCIGLNDLTPGFAIDIFIPYVIEGTFQIEEFTHVFNPSGWETSISIEQAMDSDLSLIKRNSEAIKEVQSSNNPNAMLYSYPLFFNDASLIESSSNIVIEDGKLKLSGADTGFIISKELVLPEDSTSIEIRFNGQDIDQENLTVFQGVLNGNDNDFETVSAGKDGNPGTLRILSNIGKRLKIRITLKSNSNNPNPEIESAIIYAK